MTPKEVRAYFKSSCYEFHKVTGMSAATLQNWLSWGYVPENAQYRLESITQGRLKFSKPIVKGKKEKNG
jgi:DNA-binding transcriptional regulator YiaG